MKKYLNRVSSNLDYAGGCGCGSRGQSVEHLLLDCRLYRNERALLKKELNNAPLTYKLLMNTAKGVSEVIKMLKSTRIATRKWILGEKEGSRKSHGWGDMEQ